ncbi:hypothetical protein ACE6H2_005627 [Prunus campanulata]
MFRKLQWRFFFWISFFLAGIASLHIHQARVLVTILKTSNHVERENLREKKFFEELNLVYLDCKMVFFFIAHNLDSSSSVNCI